MGMRPWEGPLNYLNTSFNFGAAHSIRGKCEDMQVAKLTQLFVRESSFRLKNCIVQQIKTYCFLLYNAGINRKYLYHLYSLSCH